MQVYGFVPTEEPIGIISGFVGLARARSVYMYALKFHTFLLLWGSEYKISSWMAFWPLLEGVWYSVSRMVS